MEKQFLDLNKQAPAPAITNKAPTPGTTETPGISEAPASTTTSETSETSSTSEAPAASEAVPATINATSTGEPVTEQAPATSEVSTPEIATSETPASTAPEKTGKVETPAPANADQPDTAVDVRRQRVEELKKSLTSGSGSVATPAPATTNETPTPGTSNITAEIGTDTSEAPAEIISEAPAEIISETPEEIISETPTPAPDSTTPASTAATSATLPEGYLADGSMVDDEGALRPEYIGKYAEALAEKLKPLPASTFYSAFLREAKALRKKKTPYGAQKNCTLGMMTQAKKLAHRKKDPAPGVLVEMITAATATVKDPATFEALYMHLDAVYTNLLVG